MTLVGIKKKFIIFIINNFLSVPKYFVIKEKLMRCAGYKIGKNTKIVGPLKITSNLQVGENTWIGANFTCHGNGSVIIGNNCDIAPDVTFLTGGHKIGLKDRRAGKGESYKIIVEDGVWIGARATILKNIIIESMSVIAACSCVNNDVLKNTLVAGVPAKIRKKIGVLDEK